jgi:hypothetical protein
LPPAGTAHARNRLPVLERVPAACGVVSLGALCGVPARITFARAVQPKQTFHDADLHHHDHGTALVAAQFYITVFHGGDNDAGTIDTSDPESDLHRLKNFFVASDGV